MNVIPLSLDQYIIEPASKRFKSLFSEPVIHDLFDFLAAREQVEAFISATLDRRPAMEYVIEEIENLFVSEHGLDLAYNYRHRQITGSMIRFIMGFYGYYPEKAYPLKRGRYIKTAIRFKMIKKG